MSKKKAVEAAKAILDLRISRKCQWRDITVDEVAAIILAAMTPEVPDIDVTDESFDMEAAKKHHANIQRVKRQHRLSPAREGWEGPFTVESNPNHIGSPGPLHIIANTQGIHIEINTGVDDANFLAALINRASIPAPELPDWLKGPFKAYLDETADWRTSGQWTIAAKGSERRIGWYEFGDDAETIATLLNDAQKRSGK